MKCKVSGKEISKFMTFGKMPMANGFLDKKNFNDEFFYNLEVGFSQENYLFQINEHPKSQKIFNNRSKMNGLSTSAKWTADLENQLNA